MRLSDDKTINEMAGKKLYSIYAEYVDGAPKEYVGRIKEYIILGVSKERNDNRIMLWDIDKQEVYKAWRENIQRVFNRSNIRTRIWGDVYAYAFTKEAAKKCLKGLEASIDANYERKQKWKQIETRNYLFTLDKLRNSGIRNLACGGVEATDVTIYNDHKAVKFCLPDDYEKSIDQRSLQDLRALDSISTGKHIFENSGNDACNLGEKGKLISERDITVLIEISEDERRKKDLVKTFTFKAGDKYYLHNVRWLKLRVYIKLPQNNYASVKKFNKFFTIYDLQKVN